MEAAQRFRRAIWDIPGKPSFTLVPIAPRRLEEKEAVGDFFDADFGGQIGGENEAEQQGGDGALHDVVIHNRNAPRVKSESVKTPPGDGVL
jgi:hypothetical protein